MNTFVNAFEMAFQLLFSLNGDLFEIVGLSLMVSLFALMCASVISFPLGGILALVQFPGCKAAVVLLNALMGLPPVVVGLSVYLLLSRSGPLGALGLLYTPGAMILAQTILIIPIIAALSHRIIVDLHHSYDELFRSMCVPKGTVVRTLLWDGRFALLTVLMAGFGRAIAEVGAVIMVGGNIDHATRVMTTAIALETSKGDLAMAMALGIILIAVSVTISGLIALSSKASNVRSSHA